MRRSNIALLTAVLVFVLTYLSAWVAMRNNPFMTLGNPPLCWTMSRMHFIGEALSEYAKKNGRYPESLEELTKSQESDSYLGQAATVTDYWEHPFQYEKTRSGYRLCSFGLDGKPGGVGIYADLEYDGQGIRKWPAATRINSFLKRWRAAHCFSWPWRQVASPRALVYQGGVALR